MNVGLFGSSYNKIDTFLIKYVKHNDDKGSNSRTTV